MRAHAHSAASVGTRTLAHRHCGGAGDAMTDSAPKALCRQCDILADDFVRPRLLNVLFGGRAPNSGASPLSNLSFPTACVSQEVRNRQAFRGFENRDENAFRVAPGGRTEPRRGSGAFIERAPVAVGRRADHRGGERLFFSGIPDGSGSDRQPDGVQQRRMEFTWPAITAEGDGRGKSGDLGVRDGPCPRWPPGPQTRPERPEAQLRPWGRYPSSC